MLEFRAAWDRHDPGLLREQPGKRDLSRRAVLAGGQRLQEVDHLEVGFHGLGRKTWEILAQVVGVIERHAARDRAGQEALAQRTPGDEADAQLFTEGEL